MKPFVVFIFISSLLPGIFSQVQFDSHTIVGGDYAAFRASSVFAANLDADGDMDVLSASTIDNKIAWYENDGNEIFTPHTITTDARNARSGIRDRFRQ